MAKETVLYYLPESQKEGGNTGKAAKVKSVLIRMGVRIKNITAEQTGETVGYLAGMDGYEGTASGGTASGGTKEVTKYVTPVIEEEMLVMKNFTSRRIDELLARLKRAGVPKIALKAVVTETNAKWTFSELYAELKKEHEAMTVKEE